MSFEPLKSMGGVGDGPEDLKSKPDKGKQRGPNPEASKLTGSSTSNEEPESRPAQEPQSPEGPGASPAAGSDPSVEPDPDANSSVLMVSGDRQISVGERGPFYPMLAQFSRYFKRVDVLCPRPDRPVTTTSVHGNCFFHPADVGRSRMVGYVVRRGAQLIAEHGHRVIVSHDYGRFYNGRGAAQLSSATSVPYLSEIHHVPGYPVPADLRERLDFQLAKAYVGWARKRAKAFRVVNSLEMPELLRRWGVQDEQILVLPSLYIDLELFREPTPRPEPQQDLVFVGRMVNNKGLDRIVDALALLAKQGLVLKTLFVGRGPLAEPTKKRAKELGIESQLQFIEWVDSQADLARIYSESRAVICASTCEGGPRVTVEGMACGTPSISTPVGMMRELIRDGENGILVDFTTEGLAQGLRRLFADEAARREMGAQAKRAVADFEYEATIRGYALGVRALGE